MMAGKRKKKHDFKKVVLLIAFIQITVFSIWQMVVFTITGNEAATLIQWFFTLWGIEAGMLMLKTIIDKKRKNKVEENGE